MRFLKMVPSFPRNKDLSLIKRELVINSFEDNYSIMQDTNDIIFVPPKTFIASFFEQVGWLLTKMFRFIMTLFRSPLRVEFK